MLIPEVLRANTMQMSVNIEQMMFWLPTSGTIVTYAVPETGTMMIKSHDIGFAAPTIPRPSWRYRSLNKEGEGEAKCHNHPSSSIWNNIDCVVLS